MAYNPLQYLTQNQPNTFAMLSQVGRSLGEGRRRQLELSRQAEQRKAGAKALGMLGPEGLGAEGFDMQGFTSGLVEADPFSQGLGRSLLQQQFKPAGAMSVTELNNIKLAKQGELEPLINEKYAQIQQEQDPAKLATLTQEYDSLIRDYNQNAIRGSLEWGKAATYQRQQSDAVKAKLGIQKDELALKTGEQALKKGEQGMQIAQEGRYDKVLSQWSKVNKKPIEIANTIQAAKSFVGNAKNNAVMAKNLLFAVSRLGSNEAVTADDLDIMIAGNLSDEARAYFDKKFGSGARVPEKAVDEAIQTLNSTESNWMPRFYKAVGAGVDRLRSVDFKGTDEQAEQFLTGYLARPKAMTKQQFLQKWKVKK